MAGAGETARLEMFRDLLSDAHRALDLQFGFELWDGSTIPADLPSYAMRLVIRRESVVAALLRRPNLDTALNAYVSGLLDLKNGTIFDLADQRPRGKVGRQLKADRQAQGTEDRLSLPARAGRHAAPPRPGRGQGRTPVTAGPRPTSRTSPTITTCRTSSISSSSIRRWSIPAPISSRTGTTTSPALSSTSST